MPNFLIVEARACHPSIWLATWSEKYDNSEGFDEGEYIQLINLASCADKPEGYFERVGRWKDSANTTRRWRPNVASVAYLIWRQAEEEKPICPTNEQVVSFLEGWSSRTYEDNFPTKSVRKQFGLSRATTLLHFLSGGRFPIYDSNVIKAMRRLYEANPSNTANYYWNNFYPQFQELADACGTEDFRGLDKALFSYGATRLLD